MALIATSIAGTLATFTLTTPVSYYYYYQHQRKRVTEMAERTK